MKFGHCERKDWSGGYSNWSSPITKMNHKLGFNSNRPCTARNIKKQANKKRRQHVKSLTLLEILDTL